MKIIQNVYLVKTLLSNCYLIEEGDELILIDAGAPSGYNQIAGSIRSIGRDPGELTGILLTHADIDHVGTAKALKEESGARIYASRIAAEALANGHSSRSLSMGILTPLFDWFEARNGQMQVTVDEILSDGDELPVLGGLKVVETPGHTPCHITFYAEDQSLLFAGDAIRTRKDLVEYNQLTVANWDEGIMHQSVRKLAELQPEIVCSGHGPVVFGAADKFDLEH